MEKYTFEVELQNSFLTFEMAKQSHRKAHSVLITTIIVMYLKDCSQTKNHWVKNDMLAFLKLTTGYAQFAVRNGKPLTSPEQASFTHCFAEKW